MEKALAALEDEAVGGADYASFLDCLLKNKELTLYRLLSAHAECAEWSPEKIVLRGDAGMLEARLAEIRIHLANAGLSPVPEITLENAATKTSPPRAPAPPSVKAKATPHPDVAHVKKFFPDAILVALDESDATRPPPLQG